MDKDLRILMIFPIKGQRLKEEEPFFTKIRTKLHVHRYPWQGKRLRFSKDATQAVFKRGEG
jgi:hypothetical protein